MQIPRVQQVKYNAKTRRTHELSDIKKMRKAQKLDCLHHVYATVVAAFVFQLSHRYTEQVGWNQTAINSGEKGINIPFDEDTEHRNNCIKQGIKNEYRGFSKATLSCL